MRWRLIIHRIVIAHTTLAAIWIASHWAIGTLKLIHVRQYCMSSFSTQNSSHNEYDSTNRSDYNRSVIIHHGTNTRANKNRLLYLSLEQTNKDGVIRGFPFSHTLDRFEMLHIDSFPLWPAHVGAITQTKFHRLAFGLLPQWHTNFGYVRQLLFFFLLFIDKPTTLIATKSTWGKNIETYKHIWFTWT